MKKFYTILFILSVIGIFIYYIAPEKHFSDFVYPLKEGMVLSVYDDKADGGFSNASLSLTDSTILFSCSLHTEKTPAWCGLLWNFVPDTSILYKNWMLVDTLVFDVDLKGTNEFLIKLWTYDPDVTNRKNKFSYRPLIKEVITAKEGRQRIVVPISELYVPDYWFKTQKVSKNLQLKHLESAASFELSAGWNTKRGQPFSIRIYSIEAKGVSSFTLGFILFFFLALVTIAVGVRHKKATNIYEKTK